MNISLAFLIFAEVVFTLLLVWGFMHEEKFVAFEDAVMDRIKKAVKNSGAKKEVMKREKLNRQAVYTPVKPGRRNSVSWDTAA